MHLQRPEAGVFFRAVFAKEGRPGRRGGGPSLLLFLGGAAAGQNARAFHPLARGKRVHGLRAGGVRSASFIFFPAAAGAAAEAGGGAEVQGARDGRRFCLGGGQIEGWQDTQVPHQTRGEAGGGGAAVRRRKLGKRITFLGSVWDKKGGNVLGVKQ